MAAMKRVASRGDIKLLLSRLKDGFPGGSKHMWQVVKEIQEEKLEANVFTDQWPNFTTVVSQEFSPKLSQVADLRIYTTSKEKVVPLFEEANLIDNVGSMQTIQYILEPHDCEGMASILLNYLNNHPKTKEMNSSIIFDYPAYIFSEERSLMPNILPILPGLYIKDIPVETAEFIAEHWKPAILDYPFTTKMEFLKNIILHYGMLGVYTLTNPNLPVAWCGFKPGGILGLGYTMSAYRNLNLYGMLIVSMLERMIIKGYKSFGETHEVGVLNKPDRYCYDQSIGRSQIISIQ